LNKHLNLYYLDGGTHMPNNVIVKSLLPSNIEITDPDHSKELVERLLPGVISKMYSGDLTLLDHQITAESLIRKDFNFTIDPDKEYAIGNLSVEIEASLAKFPRFKELEELSVSHTPVRAVLDPYSGMSITWQKK